MKSLSVTGEIFMFNQLLPQRIDNTYQGHKVALWLFALLVTLKVLMSLNSIINGRFVAGTADGIPLDTFMPAGAQAVVSLYAIWGLGQLTICVLCILVLVRYRAMIPFMFGVLLLEHLSRKLMLQVMPIVKTGTSPAFTINTALLTLMIAGLALSLWRQDKLQAQE
jgi:hypothetical protein